MSRFLPAMTVAREIHRLATNQNRSITPLQLIKITFISHGWGYPCLERRLIDDPAEAWKYGPVYSELYHDLKHKGRDPVEFVPFSVHEQKKGHDGKVSIEEVILEDDEKELIEVMYYGYKSMSGSQLITLTHKKGTPWDRTEAGVIDEGLIREYYMKEAESV